MGIFPDELAASTRNHSLPYLDAQTATSDPDFDREDLRNNGDDLAVTIDLAGSSIPRLA
jgi:hypothetical protein